MCVFSLGSSSPPRSHSHPCSSFPAHGGCSVTICYYFHTCETIPRNRSFLGATCIADLGFLNNSTSQWQHQHESCDEHLGWKPRCGASGHLGRTGREQWERLGPRGQSLKSESMGFSVYLGIKAEGRKETRTKLKSSLVKH